MLRGLEVTQVSAHLETFVPGRLLDDHFTTYCKLSNGGKALVRASQICIGHKNDLGIEVVGTKGSLVWNQEVPEELEIHLLNQPKRTYYRGEVQANDGFLKDLPEDLMAEPTLPPGHPEGFHDAFARLHEAFGKTVRAWQAGEEWQEDGRLYANVEDGYKGLAFIDVALKSSKNAGAWTDFE